MSKSEFGEPWDELLAAAKVVVEHGRAWEHELCDDDCDECALRAAIAKVEEI